MAPAEVRALHPTEVASILGTDRQLSVVPVPMLDGDFIDLQADGVKMPPLVMPPPGEQRLRRVVTDDA